MTREMISPPLEKPPVHAGCTWTSSYTNPLISPGSSWVLDPLQCPWICTLYSTLFYALRAP